jgi:hypothetical protein
LLWRLSLLESRFTGGGLGVREIMGVEGMMGAGGSFGRGGGGHEGVRWMMRPSCVLMDRFCMI